jgi:hypothetical protein
VEAVVGRSTGIGSIGRLLWISGRVFFPFVDGTVIVKAVSQALFDMLYILVNENGSKDIGL